jgi:hypothetical protein
VGVAGDEIVAVVYFDHITILGVEVRVDDHTAGCRVDRGARSREEVDSLVKSALPAEWVDAPAIV